MPDRTPSTRSSTPSEPESFAFFDEGQDELPGTVFSPGNHSDIAVSTTRHLLVALRLVTLYTSQGFPTLGRRIEVFAPPKRAFLLLLDFVVP